jgi:ABC-2 type transport system ATP-binding protein
VGVGGHLSYLVPARRDRLPGHRQEPRTAVAVEVDQLTEHFGPEQSRQVHHHALDLDAPTAGRALVDDRRYGQIVRPLGQVGSLLDANALHPVRSAWCHARSVAQSSEIG